MWQCGLFVMDISILGLKETINIVDFLLHSQPLGGIIRTTAYNYSLLFSLALYGLFFLAQKGPLTYPFAEKYGTLHSLPRLDHF
jgi:hypothetical protein